VCCYSAVWGNIVCGALLCAVCVFSLWGNVACGDTTVTRDSWYTSETAVVRTAPCELFVCCVVSEKVSCADTIVYTRQLIDFRNRRSWNTRRVLSIVFAGVIGVLSAVQLMEGLRAKGVVGRRLAPPYDVFNAGPLDSQKLVEWVRENHFTAYHWASTCQAGVQGRVADQRFRVRDSASLSAGSTKSNASDVSADGVAKGHYEGVVRNLLVGSAASLPELPDANPHLTITAFSVALAEELVHAQAARRGVRYIVPSELRRAADEAHTGIQQQKRGEQAPLMVRRPGQEVPAVGQVAAEHYEAWKRSRGDKA
jgi:hypothetical protein